MVLYYVLKKIAYALLVFWGIITLMFLLFNVLPGDPAHMIMGQRTDQRSYEIIRKDLGLDQKTYIQYLKYLNDISPISVHNVENTSSFFYLNEENYQPYLSLFNISDSQRLILKWPYLRRSYQNKEKVSVIISNALPNSILLALVSILIAGVVGISLGIITASYKDTAADRLLLFFSTFGMSLPSFFSAIIIGWIFAYLLGDLTGLNITGNLYEVDDFGEGEYLSLINIILPAVTLSIRPLSVFLQLTRNSMLDVLSQDFILTARAKGASKKRIIFKHALKNALNPVITAISGWLASLMAGVVFVEYIFGWKGLGYVIVDALNNYDFPLIIGCILAISLIFLIINFLVDVVYSLLDPRVRLV